mgnify:FL=1
MATFIAQMLSQNTLSLKSSGVRQQQLVQMLTFTQCKWHYQTFTKIKVANLQNIESRIYSHSQMPNTQTMLQEKSSHRIINSKDIFLTYCHLLFIVIFSKMT